MMDKNKFQDHEEFKKEALQYHSDQNNKNADRIVYYDLLNHDDKIMRCHYCGSHDIDTGLDAYFCRECLIKKTAKDKLISREEAAIEIDKRQQHNFELYQKTLDEFPITRAIIEYAEEHGLMKMQVRDIILRMKAEGIKIEKPKVSSMVESITSKMRVSEEI